MRFQRLSRPWRPDAPRRHHDSHAYPASMDYQQWMLAEEQAVDNALSHGASTETLW